MNKKSRKNKTIRMRVCTRCRVESILFMVVILTTRAADS